MFELQNSNLGCLSAERCLLKACFLLPCLKIEYNFFSYFLVKCHCAILNVSSLHMTCWHLIVTVQPFLP